MIFNKTITGGIKVGDYTYTDFVQEQNLKPTANRILEEYNDYFDRIRKIGLSKFLPKTRVNKTQIIKMIRQGSTEEQLHNILMPPIEDIFRDGDILVELDNIYIISSNHIHPITIEEFVNMNRDALGIKADDSDKRIKYRHLEPTDGIPELDDLYIGINNLQVSARKLSGNFSYPTKIIRIDREKNSYYTSRDIWKDVIVSTINLVDNFTEFKHKLYPNMSTLEIANLLSSTQEFNKNTYNMKIAIGKLIKSGLSDEDANEIHWLLPGSYSIEFGGAPANNPNYFSYIKVSMIIRMFKNSKTKLEYSEQLAMANKHLKNINRIVGILINTEPQFKKSKMKLSYFDVEKMVTKYSTIEYILTLRISENFKEKVKDYIENVKTN